MTNRKHHNQPRPIIIGRKDLGLAKVGVSRFDLRDPYYTAVSLRFPGFAAVMLGFWLTINMVFATLYVLSPGDIVNARPGSFIDAFFFSIETLATVGYGVMAPASLYGHIVSSAEIVTGMAFTAIVTGLLFVRFSRPKAKILYSDDAVITTHNGKAALMLRLGNGRATMMSDADAQLFVLLAEHSAEGTFLRRVHELRLQQSHLPLFAMPWLLIHIIDESSPLHGCNAATLAGSDTRLILTVSARDHALSAFVQDLRDYPAQHIRFGMRFADAVTMDERGIATADMTRIGLLQPDGEAGPVA
jgi:inward rectifier potassium channel